MDDLLEDTIDSDEGLGTEFKISYEEDTALERESPEDTNDALPEDPSQ